MGGMDRKGPDRLLVGIRLVSGRVTSLARQKQAVAQIRPSGRQKQASSENKKTRPLVWPGSKVFNFC
jgi:hypothetical protein